MTVDYDTPRRTHVEAQDDTLEPLAGRRNDTSTPLGVDEAEPVDSYNLPDLDLSGEELMVQVVPKQPDEFTCSSCFLVHHRSRLARGRNGDAICTECA